MIRDHCIFIILSPPHQKNVNWGGCKISAYRVISSLYLLKPETKCIPASYFTRQIRALRYGSYSMVWIVPNLRVVTTDIRMLTMKPSQSAQLDTFSCSLTTQTCCRWTWRACEFLRRLHVSLGAPEINDAIFPGQLRNFAKQALDTPCVANG